MAIGLGKIFGFHFPENFDHPYVSKSITEFWRRWHISLGSWFRDYVYIPLGGNRVSKIKFLRNILIVWLLTGIWHGASWNFILWGLYFFVFLIIEKSLFTRGNKIIVTGIRREDAFIAKKYSKTPFHLVEQIVDILPNGEITIRHERAEVI